jgi:hypothetical protein
MIGNKINITKTTNSIAINGNMPLITSMTVVSLPAADATTKRFMAIGGKIIPI